MDPSRRIQTEISDGADNFDIKALMKKYKNTINTGHL
jgi:hypothetical protein